MSIRSTELLWKIRALVAVLKNAGASHGEHAERLLSHALLRQSPLEIATVIGAAAELRIFPTEVQMQRCHAIVSTSDDVAVRAMIWVVHHRKRRLGNTKGC